MGHMPGVMCHLSRVRCQSSSVTCQVSGFIIIFFFFDELGQLVGGGSVINGAYLVYLLEKDGEGLWTLSFLPSKWDYWEKGQ